MKKIITNLNVFFTITIIFVLFLFISYCLYRIFNPIYLLNLNNEDVILRYKYSIFVSSFIILILFFSLFLSNKIKNYLVFFISLIICTSYLLEFYLLFNKRIEFDSNIKRSIEDKKGVINDTFENRIKFIREKKTKGNEIKFNFYPRFFIDSRKYINGINFKNQKIFPLGSLPNSFSFFFSESGKYPLIKFDENGFNNSDPEYNNLDVVILGDSFAEGWSVDQNENFASILKKRSINTVSFGKSNNSLLSEYATFVEYGKPLKPNIILWMYFPNDVLELEGEKKSNFLMQYLDHPNFKQNLINKKTIIGEALNKVIKEEKIDLFKKNNKNIEEKYIFKFIKLVKLRKMLKAFFFKPDYDLIINILNKAKNATENWGGKFYFVYLPAFYDDRFKKEIFELLNKNQIEIIDIELEIFKNREIYNNLFTLEHYGHYTAEGYEKITEVILKKIKHEE